MARQGSLLLNISALRWLVVYKTLHTAAVAENSTALTPTFAGNIHVLVYLVGGTNLIDLSFRIYTLYTV